MQFKWFHTVLTLSLSPLLPLSLWPRILFGDMATQTREYNGVLKSHEHDAVLTLPWPGQLGEYI